MISYLTHFDHAFLPHGMAMIESLPREAFVSVLALDEECERRLGEAKASRPFVVYSLDMLESYLRDEGFQIDAVKAQRTHREWCWSLEPAWCYSALRNTADGNIVVYCDSDLYFFTDPTPGILEAMDKADVAITPHYFPPGAEHREQTVGRYNFGFGVFRACEATRKLVDGWLRQTLDRCDEHGAGDQRYLDDWPALMGDRLTELSPVWNSGPWRLAEITGDPPCINGERLVCYHAHEFRRGPGRNPVTINGEAWNRTNYPIPDSTLQSVYKPYEAALAKWI